MPGEIRDRRTGARLKGVYKMVVRAAMMCGTDGVCRVEDDKLLLGSVQDGTDAK